MILMAPFIFFLLFSSPAFCPPPGTQLSMGPALQEWGWVLLLEAQVFSGAQGMS